MKSIVAIVGRPNVGKSTLFNRLTRTRRALVHDLPGVTRDRLYGEVRSSLGRFTLVDTGGFDPPADQAFAPEVHSQVEMAMEEADLILFITDGRQGISPLDYEVAGKLRRTKKPVVLAVNKVDGSRIEEQAQEFHALGMETVHFISAAHGRGVGDLVDDIIRLLGGPDAEEGDEGPGEIRVALMGRPNVGKSSLLNAITGQPRVVVSDVGGTTRDAVDTPFSLDGKDYLLIDTAGIRRQGKVRKGIEKAGVFRSLRAMERAHVGVVLIDGSQGVAEQDLRVAGQVFEAHRGLIIVINKWDLAPKGRNERKGIYEDVKWAFRFAPWAPIMTMSALKGRGVEKLLPTVDLVYEEYSRRLETGPLNRALEMSLEKHPPPYVGKRRLKFFYATQVSARPPTVVVFVSDPKAVHFSYRRYLVNELRGALGLKNGPLRLVLKERSGRKPRRGRS